MPTADLRWEPRTWVGKLPDDAFERLIRRARRITDPEIAPVVRRLREHAGALANDLRWAERDLDSARAWGSQLATEAAHLRERCSDDLYVALNDLWESLHETEDGELFEDFTEEHWDRFGAAYAQAGYVLAGGKRHAD